MSTAKKTASVEEERRRNLEDIIRQARWNAKMVKKMGRKWFEIRDKWLMEAFKNDKEIWKDPKTKKALIKALLTEDKALKEHP